MPQLKPDQVARDLKFYFQKYDYDAFTDEQIRQFAKFWAYLMEVNTKVNMTRIHRLEDAAVKHFIDCAIVKKFIPKLPSPLLDLGTGPGFPGVPLKIISPETRIILAEGVQSRVNFLKEVRVLLGYEGKGLDIIGRNIDTTFQYQVEGAITRAVELMEKTLESVKFAVRVGGQVIFMKGPDVEEELKAAKKKMGSLFELTQDMKYSLPKTQHYRRLIVFTKKKKSEEVAPLPEIEDDED